MKRGQRIGLAVHHRITLFTLNSSHTQKMMKTKIISSFPSVASVALVLTTSLIQVGCGGIAPETLRHSTQEKVINLAEQVSWKQDWAWNLTLKSGSYVEQYEDDQGTYYVGPKPCLFASKGTTSIESAEVKWNCAIFIPTIKTAAPIVYLVFGSHQQYAEIPASAASDTTSQNQENKNDANPANAPVAPQQATGGMPHVVGGAIGVGIVSGIITAEQGRFRDVKPQPPVGWLQSATAIQPTDAAAPTSKQ